ncbi:hypothetical protein GCM10009605_16960 [Nocardiopsis composta]
MGSPRQVHHIPTGIAAIPIEHLYVMFTRFPLSDRPHPLGDRRRTERTARVTRRSGGRPRAAPLPPDGARAAVGPAIRGGGGADTGARPPGDRGRRRPGRPFGALRGSGLLTRAMRHAKL